jgi:chromosome segregation ATPase
VTPAEWTAILIALISAGLLKYAVDAVKAFRNRARARTPEALQATQIATVDQSLAVVARARDELEADNSRLRLQMAEAEARHEADRARWELRDKSRREEIEVLEAKLRQLLTEVEKLKDRHLYDEMEARRARPRTDPNGFPKIITP